MVRFGLTEDSDDEAPQTQIILNTRAVDPERGQSASHKGKGRAITSPDARIDDRSSRGRAATKRWDTYTNANQTPVQQDIRTSKGQSRHSATDQGESKQPVRAVSGETTEDELDYDYNYHEDDYDEEEEVFQRRRTSAPPPSWPEQLGMEPHRMHVMQASLFRTSEAKENEKNNSDDHSNKVVAKKLKLKSKLAGLEPKEHVEKLLSASSKLLRKHSRSSEGGGSHFDRLKRATFDKSVDPEPYHPSRKVVRMQDVEFLTAGMEGAYVDAGLAFGRSTRVSWGPGGMLARAGVLSSSTVYIQNIAVVAGDEETEKARASQLLETQINESIIELNGEDIPIAFPARTLTFSTFASLLPETDNTHEAQIWRQGVALFDPIARIPISISSLTKQYLIALQRRTALADWLATTVAPTVSTILREQSTSTSAERAFVRLTGRQIEEAADAAAAEGNVHLAMLISQAGGDAEFRADVAAQLAIWVNEGCDKLTHESYRKCMAVLAGVTSLWRPPSDVNNTYLGSEINVVKGLDWKRAFGLMLWYGPGSENMEGFESALERFERHLSRNEAPFPVLSYQKPNATERISSSALASLDSQTIALDEADGSFELLRLAAGQIPLERAIYPRAFSSSPLDYRMPWHLYILLSRAMRMKDFSDRQYVEENPMSEEPGVEGHSDIADSVTCAYATQLEALGQLQKAVFVLLHLESSNGRKKAIQDLLCRQASSLEDWQIIGLQSMSIPSTWIEYALGCLALYEGRAFDAYEHFLKADEQKLAHHIAMHDLAPEAVIKSDMTMLRALFHSFDPQAADDWSFRGKLFLDYADVMERLPILVSSIQTSAIHDAVHAAELHKFQNFIPRLIRMIPDTLQDRTDPLRQAVLNEILSKLLSSFDNIYENTNRQLDFDSDLVNEADRLQHIHNTIYHRFLLSLPA